MKRGRELSARLSHRAAIEMARDSVACSSRVTEKNLYHSEATVTAGCTGEAQCHSELTRGPPCVRPLVLKWKTKRSSQPWPQHGREMAFLGHLLRVPLSHPFCHSPYDSQAVS